MALINTVRAWFFDAKGEYHGSKSFSKHAKNFKYGVGSYIVNLKATNKRDKPIIALWHRRTFYYNLDNPNPLILDKKGEPLIDPEALNINLETKVLRDLNDLANDNFSKYITPKNIILGLVVIGLIIYLATGNKLF